MTVVGKYAINHQYIMSIACLNSTNKGPCGLGVDLSFVRLMGCLRAQHDKSYALAIIIDKIYGHPIPVPAVVTQLKQQTPGQGSQQLTVSCMGACDRTALCMGACDCTALRKGACDFTALHLCACDCTALCLGACDCTALCMDVRDRTALCLSACDFEFYSAIV